MMAYKGQAYVLGRSSDSSNLYSEEDGKLRCRIPPSIFKILTDYCSFDGLARYILGRSPR